MYFYMALVPIMKRPPAGEEYLLTLYGAEKFETLNKYRHVAYKRGVAKKAVSGSFQLATLPPTCTSAAAR